MPWQGCDDHREGGVFVFASASAIPQAQGGQGLRTSATATAGGSVTVNVSPNDPSIEVTDPATGATTNVPVSPGKDTQVPIPNVPGGSFLTIKVGTGRRARIILVEVIAPGP